MESSIKINILSNEEVVDDLPDVPVDKNLQACLISKALVHRLGVHYEAVPKSSVTDSMGRTHTVIGKIELRWHRRESARSHHQRFSVVDTLSTDVILGASALPKGKESDVHTLGLNQQTEDQKKEQEKKNQDAQARRDKEKKEQAEKEKQKQASQKISQTSQSKGK